MKDLRPWWAQWREVYFELMTLYTSASWDTKRGKPPVYSDGDWSFHEKDIDGNFDEIEEQLWAFRNGLANITIG